MTDPIHVGGCNERCDESGHYLEATEHPRCERCEGTGTTIQGRSWKSGYREDQYGTCPICHGHGTTENKDGDLTPFLLARIAEREAAITYAYEHGMAFPVLSPAEMLADCEAKRRVVELHSPTQEHAWCRSCGRPDLPNGAHEWPCSTVLALAAIYADHPDCRRKNPE